MKLLINSSNAVPGSSLHMKVSGFSIELSDVSDSGKVAVVEDSGKISIEVLPAVEILPSVEEIPVKAALLPSVADKQALEESSLAESFSDIHDISPDVLFKKLVALRRQIAQEANIPSYLIFHDNTLKDMISKMPVALDEMKKVSGVGQFKLQKYGVRFIDVIKEYLADSA